MTNISSNLSYQWKKKIGQFLSLITMIILSANVSASALTKPKSDGIIGERFDGYVDVVNQASAEIRSLVREVNQKRKEKYKQIAAKRKQPLANIELIAGKTAIGKTAQGHYIFLKGSGWQRK